MRHFFGNIFNFILPPSPEQKLLSSIEPEDLYSLLEPKSVNGIISLGSYQEPLIRSAVIAAKFQGDLRAVKLLSELLSKWLEKNNNRYNNHLWIPIPLSKQRQNERGYNQAEQILRYVSLIPADNIDTTSLVRSRHTKPQSSLNRTARADNIKDAFNIKESSIPKLEGRHIILFDDVVTSGATLNEARATLAPHSPASIICIALAH